MPTPIPSRTRPIDIPTKSITPPPLYADYTDYGEAFPGYPYDSALDEMLKLERTPNRRCSGSESPSSPIEKLQHEEHHIKDTMPAMWASEHDVPHHG